MSTDRQAIASMDCFHCYYRFQNAGGDDALACERFEAWLDYRRAILRRDGCRCSVCGKVRDEQWMDVRPRRPAIRRQSLEPADLISVCLFCLDETAVAPRVRLVM